MVVRREHPVSKKARYANEKQDVPVQRLARLSVKPAVVRLARTLEGRRIGKLREIAWRDVSGEGFR